MGTDVKRWTNTRGAVPSSEHEARRIVSFLFPGPMHPTLAAQRKRVRELIQLARADPEKALAMTQAALKAGTHGPIEAWRTVCDGCRQWVSGVWWVSPDHKRLCVKCCSAGFVK